MSSFKFTYCDSPLSVVRLLCVPAWVRVCGNFFIKTTSPLKPLIGFRPNFTGMVLGWSSTKVVHTVQVGCISRSQGQKISFQNAIFKNPVGNCKAQSFLIWYITSSRGPLPKLFKLCPWGQNWPRPGGHNFTWNYIWKTSNDFFYWTTNGNLTKLNRNGPWVVPYRNCSNGSDWLHKYVTGSTIRFSKYNLQKACLKLQGAELSYLMYNII